MGEAVETATQFPEISFSNLLTKEYNVQESGVRLTQYIERIAPAIEEMIQFAERQLPQQEKNNEKLNRPNFIDRLGKAELINDVVAQKNKNEIYCVYNITESKISNMENNFSLIVGYINLEPTNFFFNSSLVKSLALNSREKLLLAGDTSGSISSYDLDGNSERIEHEPLSLFLKDLNILTLCIGI